MWAVWDDYNLIIRSTSDPAVSEWCIMYINRDLSQYLSDMPPPTNSAEFTTGKRGKDNVIYDGQRYTLNRRRYDETSTTAWCQMDPTGREAWALHDCLGQWRIRSSKLPAVSAAIEILFDFVWIIMYNNYQITWSSTLYFLSHYLFYF